MKYATVQAFALSLPEVTAAPHHHFGSFRVRGKIFVTTPPEQTHIHVFLAEPDREQALALFPEFMERLLWGGKVVGVKVTLAAAPAAAVKPLIRQAWANKSPKSVRAA